MPQRDPFKLLCQKGTCLKKICLKGIMSQRIMPQGDCAPKNHAILLHNHADHCKYLQTIYVLYPQYFVSSYVPQFIIWLRTFGLKTIWLDHIWAN